MSARATIEDGLAAGAVAAVLSGAPSTLHALDLGVGRRRHPRVRALAPVPQVLDHVAYGAVAGAVLSRRRSRGSRRARRAPARAA